MTFPIIRYNRNPKKLVLIILNDVRVIKIATIIYDTFRITSISIFLNDKNSFIQARYLFSTLSFLFTNRTYSRIPPIIDRMVATMVQATPLTMPDVWPKSFVYKSKSYIIILLSLIIIYHIN